MTKIRTRVGKMVKIGKIRTRGGIRKHRNRLLANPLSQAEPLFCSLYTEGCVND